MADGADVVVREAIGGSGEGFGTLCSAMLSPQIEERLIDVEVDTESFLDISPSSTQYELACVRIDARFGTGFRRTLHAFELCDALRPIGRGISHPVISAKLLIKDGEGRGCSSTASVSVRGIYSEVRRELLREGQAGSAVLGRDKEGASGEGALRRLAMLCDRGRTAEVRISKAPLTLRKSVGELIVGRRVTGCVGMRVLFRLL